MDQYNAPPEKRGIDDFLITSIILFTITRMGLVMAAGYNIFNYTIVFAAGIFAILAMFYKSRAYMTEMMQKPLLLIVAYIAMIALSYVLTNSSNYKIDIASHLKKILLCMDMYGIGIGLGYFRKNVRKAVVLVFLVEFIVSAAYTLYVGLTGPDGIIRQTAYSVNSYGFRFAYGGFDFIYACTMVYICIFQGLRRYFTRLRTSTRVLLIAVLALLAVTIIVSGFSTAFALILLTTAFAFFKKTYSRVFFLIAVIAVLFVFPTTITNFISSIPFIPTLTSERINEMILSFTQGNSITSGSYAGRFERMNWSWRIFLNYPLFGGYAGNTSSSFGNHTEWLEELAKYGAVAMLLFFGFWRKALQTFKTRTWLVENSDKCIRVTAIMLLLIGFLNPFSMAMAAAVMFILAPNFCELLEDVALPLKMNPPPVPPWGAAPPPDLNAESE